ncbi:hypothetical protein C8F01DRAFT_1081509 [Mycena amicta]|nr:hypothetical protein C8F01DRAFT_1081509 [Mycena amicta]
MVIKVYNAAAGALKGQRLKFNSRQRSKASDPSIVLPVGRRMTCVAVRMPPAVVGVWRKESPAWWWSRSHAWATWRRRWTMSESGCRHIGRRWAEAHQAHQAESAWVQPAPGYSQALRNPVKPAPAPRYGLFS